MLTGATIIQRFNCCAIFFYNALSWISETPRGLKATLCSSWLCARGCWSRYANSSILWQQMESCMCHLLFFYFFKRLNSYPGMVEDVVTDWITGSINPSIYLMTLTSQHGNFSRLCHFCLLQHMVLISAVLQTLCAVSLSLSLDYKTKTDWCARGWVDVIKHFSSLQCCTVVASGQTDTETWCEEKKGKEITRVR